MADAPAGASFKVISVNIGGEVGKRLADMGFTQDAEGAVVREGFFGGPLQARILGYDILIRRFEASGITVEPVGDWSAAYDAHHLRHEPGGHGGHGHKCHRQGCPERGNEGGAQ